MDLIPIPGLTTNYTGLIDLMSAGDQVLAQQNHDTQVLLVIIIAILIIQTVRRKR